VPVALPPVAAEIAALRRQFEDLSAAADALTAPLTDAQFTWQPPDGKWSVSQCLDHLNAAARAYLPRLDEGIADAISRGLYGEGPFRYNWLGRLSVSVTEPPPRVRVKNPMAFAPGQSRSRQEVLPAFRAYQVQYIDRLHQANGLDLARARVASPSSRFIRLPLGSAFLVLAAHERRHIWQAERVIARTDYPK
jgi:hypothetical protein